MTATFLLLFKFGYDIVKRLIQDSYFRALGSVLLLMILAGTLFYWLVSGRPFLLALLFSACTAAMNSPYFFGGGTYSVAEVFFHIIYQFFSVGLFLLFVLEAGKTMTRSYEEFTKQMAERMARKQVSAKRT